MTERNIKPSWSLLFSQYANVTISNSMSETTLISPARGALALPAYYFTPGKTLRLNARGFHSVTGSPTLDLKFKFGTTATMDTSTLSIGTTGSTQFVFEGILTCQVQGASGKLMAAGKYEEIVGASLGAPNDIPLGGTSQIGIDTTQPYVLDFTGTWGTAAGANTVTLTHFLLEQIDGN